MAEMKIKLEHWTRRWKWGRRMHIYIYIYIYIYINLEWDNL